MPNNITTPPGLPPPALLERTAPARGPDDAAGPAAAAPAPHGLAPRRAAAIGGATNVLRTALPASQRSGPARLLQPASRLHLQPGSKLLHTATTFLGMAGALATRQAPRLTEPSMPASAGPATSPTAALADTAQRRQLQATRAWIQASLVTLVAAVPVGRPAGSASRPRALIVPAEDAARTTALTYVASVAGQHIRQRAAATDALADAATAPARPSITQAPAWPSGTA